VATSEPVVLHHGRGGGGEGHDEVRPSASTACWAALLTWGAEANARVLRGSVVQSAELRSAPMNDGTEIIRRQILRRQVPG
jgi:hypothetical protein